MIRLTALLVAVCLLPCALSSYLTPCPDPPYNNFVAEIIYNELDSMRQFMYTGAPNHSIPILDPLGPIPYINYSIENPALRMHGYIDDSYVRNLAEYIICEISIDFGLRQKFDLDFRYSDFHIDGYYYVKGLYALLFPIFGNGSYTLDVYNSSLTAAADVSYNVITSHAQIHNLKIDIVFDDLQLYMECLLGCGQMANFSSAIMSQAAETIFYLVWDYIDPILENALETAINNILKGIKLPPYMRDSIFGPTDVAKGEEVILKEKVPVKDLIRELLKYGGNIIKT